MATWIEGENGNRCSIERFGSEDAARAALATLEGCSDCSGCFRCFFKDDLTGSGDTREPWVIPVIENIHQTIYAAVHDNGNKLEMSDWHICETTHCRAGWVVHLAGEAGRKLEQQTSTLFAAMQIYFKSDPSLNYVPNFFTTNERAMQDMKRLAEQEATK